MAFTSRFICCCSLIALALLAGCSTMFGPGSDPRVKVAPNATVTDLRDNSSLPVKAASEDSFFVRVKNGQRHVLRVERDSSTSYVFLDPAVTSSIALNLLSPFMIGFVVDHFTDALYTMRQARIESTTLSESAERASYEDSLRRWLKPVVPTSVLNPTENPFAFAWLATAVDFNSDNSWFALGASMQLTPLLLPMVEAGILSTSRSDFNPFWMAGGIQIQEPERGLCAALRLGYVVSGNANAADSPAFFGAASAGIYGQWARLELRYRQTFSSHSTLVSDTKQNGYLGIHFAVHLIL